MPIVIHAALWGLLAASGLVLGAVLAWVLRPPTRVVAGVLAFGCGLLISAVAFELVAEGFHQGGSVPLIAGALLGSLLYTGANALVTRQGGRHHRRSHGQTPAGEQSGLVLVVGVMLDGVPESLVLGIGLLVGGGVSMAFVVAVFLSNLAEGLTGAANLRAAGYGRRFTLGIWVLVALALAVSAGVGAALPETVPLPAMAFINAIAAGALLTMIADTMIPEAVHGVHGGTGLLVVIGMLCAFFISHGLG